MFGRQMRNIYVGRPKHVNYEQMVESIIKYVRAIGGKANFEKVLKDLEYATMYNLNTFKIYNKLNSQGLIEQEVHDRTDDSGETVRCVETFIVTN